MPSLKDVYKKIFTVADVVQARGDLVSGDGTQITRLPLGFDTQVLTVDTSTSLGLAWVTTDIGYAVVNSAFTQPALNSTVAVSVSTTRWMNVGMFIYIDTGGVYEIISIATNSVTVRNSYSENTSQGTSIGITRRITPAGRRGQDGNNTYTNTSSNFVVPAINSSVTVNVVYTSWVLVGQVIFVEGAGYYRVDSKTSTSLTISNLGYDFNASQGSTIVQPKTVASSGVRGENGISPVSYTTGSATMPSVNGTVVLALSETRWLGVGQHLYLQSVGAFRVEVVTANTATLMNIGGSGNFAGGSSIPSNTKIVSSGITGASGSNALVTNTTSSFAQPIVNNTVAIPVSTTEFLATGSFVFIEGAGYYQVVSIDSPTSLTIRNTGNVDNAASGITVPSNRLVVPASRPGVNGLNGTNGINGTNGVNGISPLYLGELVSPPAGSLNNIYRQDDSVYWYDGIEWKLLLRDGIDGVDGQVGSVSSATSLQLAHQSTPPSLIVNHLVLFSDDEGLYAIQPSGNTFPLFPLTFSKDSVTTPFRPKINFTGLVSLQDDSANNTLNLNFSLPLTSSGDLLYHNGTQLARLPRGTQGQVLSAHDTSGLTWVNPLTSYDALTDKPVLGTASSLNVGTSIGNVVQLIDSGGAPKLPSIDGSLLTNLPATSLPDILDLGIWTA